MYGRGARAQWRRYARGQFGLRGLGQADSGDVCDPTSASYDSLECSNEGGVALPIGPAPPVGYVPPTSPSGTLLTQAQLGAGSIGSSQGCASGYVVGDASGNCVPATQLAQTLSTSAGQASLGLTPSAAATITAALNAANTGIKVATGQITPTAVVVPSTNPLSSISSTTWILIAVAAGAVLLMSGRKR